MVRAQASPAERRVGVVARPEVAHVARAKAEADEEEHDAVLLLVVEDGVPLKLAVLGEDAGCAALLFVLWAVAVVGSALALAVVVARAVSQ